MAKKKSLFDMYFGQTVTYSSRSMKVTRCMSPEGTAEFIVRKTYADSNSNRIFKMKEDTDRDADSLLDYFEEKLDQQHKVFLFEDRMLQIKRGIRSKVRKHLRKKYGTLPSAQQRPAVA